MAAHYHQDIVSIDLDCGNIHRSFLHRSIGTGDSNANRFGVRVFRGKDAVDLSGVSCQGYFRNSNGENIALTSYGTVEGNKAFVTLPQACYNFEGQFTLAIKLVGGGITGTMRIIDGMVDNTNTGSAVAPTESVPTYQEILAVYDEMQTATEAAEAAATKSVRYDQSQSLTTAQKEQARQNIDAAYAPDVSKLEANTYGSDNLLQGKEYYYPQTLTQNDITFTRLGVGHYKIVGTASSSAVLNYFNNLEELPERIKPGETYHLHVEGYPVRIAHSKNGETYVGARDYEEGVYEFTLPSDAVGFTIRLLVTTGTTVNAESHVILENISELSTDYALTNNKKDFNRLTGVFAPKMVIGAYNPVDGEDVPRSSSYMADRRAIVPIGYPLHLEVGDRIVVDDPILYYYVMTYDYDNDEWNAFDNWYQGGTEFVVETEADYYIVIRKGANLEIESINDLTYKFAIVKASEAGFLYNEIEAAKKSGAQGNAIDMLPVYYRENDWFKNKLEAVKTASEIINGVSFAFVTDLHFNANAKNSKYLIKAMMDATSLNLAICGGDIVGLIGSVDQLTEQAESIVEYENYIGKDRFLPVRGNHDFYNRTDISDVDTTTALTEGKAYDTLCRANEFRVEDMLPAHMCYVIRNEAQKTVFLMMNSKDGSGTVQSNISGTQAKWIADMLMKYKDYSIIAVSHIPADSEVTGYDAEQAIIHTILAAFQAKTTISTTHDSVSISADYSTATGSVICHINGHAHEDDDNFADGILTIVTTCDAYYRDDGYNAEAGTVTEQAVDVFCIDYDNNTVKTVRVGRGYNRNWNYQSGVSAS